MAAYGRWSLKRGGFTWRFDSVFLIQNSVSLLYDCTYTTGTLHYTLQIRVYNSLNLLDLCNDNTLACPGPFSSTSYSNSNPKTNGYCKD